jgi:hypothetical protein
VPILLAVIAGVCLSFGFPLDITALQVIGVTAAVVGGVFVLDALGILEEPILRPRDPAVDQVKKLVKALAESTRVMAEIEREVKARSALAERLEADVERHRELLALNRSEVEAVAQTLRTEVHREGRRSLWTGLFINAAFFGLGILVTLLVS